MACPKSNPNYPSTARSIELPFGVICRKVDKDFDKSHRFDKVYEFGRRSFREDALTHGAYAGTGFFAEQGPNLVTEGGLRLGPERDFSFLTQGAQDGLGWGADFGSDFATDDPDLIAVIDRQFQFDNGFCDPLNDGTVQTGTGAGGANPGAVPSVGPALRTLDGSLIRTEDNRYLSPDPAPGVGVVFKGA